eukprot:12764756-Prorocentrum_lima.AAC.1
MVVWLASIGFAEGGGERGKCWHQKQIHRDTRWQHGHKGRGTLIEDADWSPGMNRGCVMITHGLPGESTSPYRGLGIDRGCATLAHGLP